MGEKGKMYRRLSGGTMNEKRKMKGEPERIGEYLDLSENI